MVGDPRTGMKDLALMLPDDRREVIGQRLLPSFIEKESDGYPQSVRDFLQRADRGGSHSPFDLANETGRDSHFLRKHLQRHPAVFSHLPDLEADGLHLCLDSRHILLNTFDSPNPRY